ncbi:MAG: type I-E CRISPR-associated protein Cas5/CasD [Candidatus Omnitrophota bacterium]|nr:type I-E CRISPR-associated protein Cas5/CasD [Candidatus Omnitrophota bacterium]
MSAETVILVLRLEGPMQSWGYDSQFNRRNTALFPTKSALAGLCCAAMGLSRGSREEKEALQKYAMVKLLCIAVPRQIKNKDIMVKRMQDYHTVQHTVSADGTPKKDAVLTYRQYLNDAFFYAFLEGDKLFLKAIAEKLVNPVWGIWLGRKACIPSAPVFAGVYPTREEAAKALLSGSSLEAFTRVQEVDSFGDGIDSYMDQPVSFEMYARKFVPRRVMLHEAKTVD